MTDTRLADVGAAIVHFHRERDAAALVAELVHSQGLNPDFVVIVDNGSNSGVLTNELHSCHVRPLVISCDNVGFAAAANMGVAALPIDARKVLVVSHEVRFEPDAVMHLVDTLRKHPSSSVGPLLTDMRDGLVWSAGGRVSGFRKMPTHHLHGHRVEDVPRGVLVSDWLDGSVLAMERETWDRIGGMDERFFLYQEDVDLGLRMKRAGYRVLVVTAARAAQSPGPGLEPYLWTRNVLLLFRAHRFRMAELMWIALTVGLLLRDLLRLGSPDARARLSRRSMGLFDGMRRRHGPPPTAFGPPT